MKFLKEQIKKNKKMYNVLSAYFMIKRSKWKKQYNLYQYPEILQFPITNRCNSRCVMCNVVSKKIYQEMTVDEFENIFADKIFKKIMVIGINGGEPFMFDSIIPFVKVMVKKKSVKSINIISNGFMTKIILEKVKEIYKICKKNKIRFYLSFSLDGYEVIHDKVRGVPGAFARVENTIRIIRDNISEYCDGFDVGCTVVKENVYNLVELDSYAKLNNFPIKYRVGVSIERLHNKDLQKSFSIFDDACAIQAAREFFWGKIFDSSNLYDQFKYWAIYSYLSGNTRKLGCDWRNNGITLDGEANVYYCAVQSKCIGNLKTNSGKEVYFSEENMKYRENIIEDCCKYCIHDYGGRPYIMDVIDFLKFKLNSRFRLKAYK